MKTLQEHSQNLGPSWTQTCKMEASQVVQHKGLFGCQVLTCIDLGTLRLFQHGAALQESSWTQPQCLVSFGGAVGGGEAIPASHKEPVWGCVGCTPAAREGFSLVTASSASVHQWYQQVVSSCSCLLSPSQHCPSKLLCMSWCLPLEMSRCCSPVRLGTAPFLPFTVCWVRHLPCGAGLLLACICSQEEPI